MDLLDAIAERRLDMVQDLLEDGADPNWTEDVAGVTPLHYAVTYNFLEVIPILLDAGVDPAKTDIDGVTPLELAEELGHDDIIALLEGH